VSSQYGREGEGGGGTCARGRRAVPGHLRQRHRERCFSAPAEQSRVRRPWSPSVRGARRPAGPPQPLVLGRRARERLRAARASEVARVHLRARGEWLQGFMARQGEWLQGFMARQGEWLQGFMARQGEWLQGFMARQGE